MNQLCLTENFNSWAYTEPAALALLVFCARTQYNFSRVQVSHYILDISIKTLSRGLKLVVYNEWYFLVTFLLDMSLKTLSRRIKLIIYNEKDFSRHVSEKISCAWMLSSDRKESSWTLNINDTCVFLIDIDAGMRIRMPY